MIVVAIVGVIVIALVTGAMLGPTIGAVGLTVLLFEFNGNFRVIPSAIWNIFSSPTLIAVPAFMLLGEMLGQTGIARRIYVALTPLFERLPGRLLQVNIATATLFSALNGSSMATAAAVGSISFHELDRKGYDRKALVGSIVGGGSLGMLIPPSVIMIIYASMVDASVGKLFAGGIVPGLMIATMFGTYVAISALVRPTMVPSEGKVVPLKQALLTCLDAWPFLFLIIAILGTILAGWATPTESAAFGVAVTLILGAIYRELTVRRVWIALRRTAIGFGTISLILMSSIVLYQAAALSGMPQEILSLVSRLSVPPWVILLVLYAIYLGLGCVLDGFGMLLLTLPIVYPLVISLGYDPIWFGIVMVILIEVSVLTPPVGFNLFVICGISNNKVSLGQAGLAALPYWMLIMVALGVFTVEPRIVTWLPSLMFPN